MIYLKPDDFKDKALSLLAERMATRPPEDAVKIKGYQAEIEKRLGDKLSQRLGWQPRCKPTVLSTGRILLPLYSDTFSFSIMAVSDDDGETWYASELLIGFGNIQPAVLERKDGRWWPTCARTGRSTRFASASRATRGSPGDRSARLDIPNPGSGLDAVRLANGHWAMIYNDTKKGRNSWPFRSPTTKARLERDAPLRAA